jgi:hypothetical protein
MAGVLLLAVSHRLFLLPAATVCLAGGAVHMWRQSSVIVGAPGAICTRLVILGLTLFGLLMGFVLLYHRRPDA